MKEKKHGNSMPVEPIRMVNTRTASAKINAALEDVQNLW